MRAVSPSVSPWHMVNKGADWTSRKLQASPKTPGWPETHDLVCRVLLIEVLVGRFLDDTAPWRPLPMYTTEIIRKT